MLTKQFVVGASGAGSQMETLPLMVNKLFGTKIKVVSGYKGGNEVFLAMERGEVQGRCGSFYSTITATRPRLDRAEEDRDPVPDRARTRPRISRCARAG